MTAHEGSAFQERNERERDARVRHIEAAMRANAPEWRRRSDSRVYVEIARSRCLDGHVTLLATDGSEPQRDVKYSRLSEEYAPHNARALELTKVQDGDPFPTPDSLRVAMAGANDAARRELRRAVAIALKSWTGSRVVVRLAPSQDHIAVYEPVVNELRAAGWMAVREHGGRPGFDAESVLAIEAMHPPTRDGGR